MASFSQPFVQAARQRLSTAGTVVLGPKKATGPRGRAEKQARRLGVQRHQGKQKPPFARYCDVCAERPEVQTVCGPPACT